MAKILSAVFLLLFCSPKSVLAAGEQIGWKTFDLGGGTRSSSGYAIRDSLVLGVIGNYLSTNYGIKSGYIPGGAPSTSGIVNGAVTVAGGVAAVADCTVEILQSGNVVYTSSTSSAGVYAFNAVAAGAYDMRASAGGYQTLTKIGISVAAGQTTTVNFALLATNEEKPQKEHKTTLGDNLFNPRAGGASKVKFNVPAAGRVSLKIYDLSGRLIRTLFEGDSNSGDMQKDWDGRDDGGRYVVPGVYFLHYVYPGGKEVRKIGVKK